MRTSNISDLATLDHKPAATSTWEPVAHLQFTQMLFDKLRGAGFQMGTPNIELTHGRMPKRALSNAGEEIKWANMFGIAEIQHWDVQNPEGLHTLLGWRNSHCQRVAMGIGVGSRVVVCSNMSFEADRKLNQIHHIGAFAQIQNDLQDLLASRWIQDRMRIRNLRVHEYKEQTMSDTDFRQFTEKVIVDKGILSPSKYSKMVDLWKNYKPNDFERNTKWRAFNVVTELLKGSTLPVIAAKTQKLHEVTMCA